MIKGYKQLTGRYLKASKKRTVLTILGIVMSVALISTIGLFFYSMQLSQIEDAKNEFGEYHILYKNADESLISKITNNPKVSRSGLISMQEEVKVDEKLSISEMTATEKALELLPYKIKEGRLPNSEKEAVVERWTLSHLNKDAKVGDKITFNNKEYTLVGILENSIENQMNNKGIILSKDSKVSKENSMLLVEISSKTNLKKAVEELKQLAPKEDVKTNTYLLMMQGVGEGSGFGGLIITLSIIIGIVVISTIAVIYNSFQISVVERIKQFGLLRAVGTTPKQIRNIVLREASLLAVIGLPIGLALGIIAIYSIGLVFKIIGGESVLSMKMTLSPLVLALSGFVGLVSIYLSALIPAFFAGRISPLVAISSRASITKEKIKKRKNKIVQKLFGFEGALASKNIKRNRKRYRITIFSIVISVVLFIAFKSFMDMALNIAKTPNESKDVHFSVIRDYQATEKNQKLDEGLIRSLKSLDTVEKVYRIYDSWNFQTAFDAKKEIEEVKNINGIYQAGPSGKTVLYSSLTVYDKESFEVSEKYLKSGTIDIEKLNENNGIVIIGKSRIFNAKTEKTYIGPAADLKVGDEIELQINSFLKDNEGVVEFGKGTVKKVKIMGIYENDPFSYRGSQQGIKMIATPEVAKYLTGESEIRPVNLNIVIKDVKMENTAKSEIESIIKADPALAIVNNIDGNRRSKTSMLMVQILVYGFVVVISLIGSVNIVNTITTNIILRRREFAALKSIGLTQKGLKKMIVIEGLLYGIVGTIYGSVIGCGLSYLMYKGLMGVRDFPWNIPWAAMAIAGASALIIGYVSVLAPLARVKRENLIDAIREDF